MSPLPQPRKPLVVFMSSASASSASIAASLFARLVGDRLETAWFVQGGGGTADGVWAAALAEVGVPLLPPEDVAGALEALVRADFVVMLGPGPAEVPQGKRQAHWPVDSRPEAGLETARDVRDELRGRVQDLAMDLLPRHYADAQ